MTPAVAGAVRAALSDAAVRLAAAGCETPRLDAELLLAETLGADRASLVSHSADALAADAEHRFDELVRRRARREPVAYILGRRHFRHLCLRVDRRVLIPRPETELLVEVGLELPADASVHDVGTGSGAVALALKHERPDLKVSASDASAAAVEVARRNAVELSLDVDVDVADGIPAGDFSLLVANLPYVRDDEWASLAPEIREFEPREALLAGADGLDAIRATIRTAPSGTRVALEHSPPQAEIVREMLAGAATRLDLAGRARVTVGLVP